MEDNLKKKSKVPHVYILLLAIILVCSALSYIIPAGHYERMTIKTGEIEREVVNPTTFKYMD